jgi:hypothetical protein
MMRALVSSGLAFTCAFIDGSVRGRLCQLTNNVIHHFPPVNP